MPEHAHHQPRDIGRPQIIFGRTHQRDAQCAERVTQGRPLRHRRHLHSAQRNADDRSQHQRDRDPGVVHDPAMQQRAADGQQHADLAGQNSTSRRDRRTHPLQRQNEQDARYEINDFYDVLGHEALTWKDCCS